MIQIAEDAENPINRVGKKNLLQSLHQNERNYALY